MIFIDFISSLISLFLWLTLMLDTCDMSESHPFTYRITQCAQNSAIYQYVSFKCSNIYTKMTILQENNWSRKSDLGTKLITKYCPLFDSGIQTFPGATTYLRKLNSCIFIFGIWLPESQNGIQKHLNSHLFPWQPFCSLEQFSFPFRDSLFGRTISLKHSLKLKMMFTEIDSLWKSGFPAGLTK